MSGQTCHQDAASSSKASRPAWVWPCWKARSAKTAIIASESPPTSATPSQSGRGRPPKEAGLRIGFGYRGRQCRDEAVIARIVAVEIGQGAPGEIAEGDGPAVLEAQLRPVALGRDVARRENETDLLDAAQPDAVHGPGPVDLQHFAVQLVENLEADRLRALAPARGRGVVEIVAHAGQLEQSGRRRKQADRIGISAPAPSWRRRARPASAGTSARPSARRSAGSIGCSPRDASGPG